MVEIKVNQGSKEWHDIRLGKITGSNFGMLMKSPSQKTNFTKTQMKYLYNVAVEALTGVEEERFISEDMARGIELEPDAVKAYENKHFLSTRECGFFTDEQFLGSSPDRIIGGFDGVLEVKCPKPINHVKYMYNPVELFEQYRWQVIGESMFTQVQRCVIISYHPDFRSDKQIVEYEYTATQGDYTKLYTRLIECVDFVKRIVE